MVNRITTLLDSENKRRYARIAAFVVLGVSVGAFVMAQFILPGYFATQAVNEFPEERLGANAYTLPASEPVALSIPKIGLQTTFEEPLGLNPDRSPEVPESFEEVGWYKHSPTPGELGPSVILGHVDSYEGPAVFFSVGQLERGDPIEITREDGSVATFHVTGIERHEQSGFPRQQVYGDIDHAGLRLVTCSGTFDKATQTYTHNTIVFAELAPVSADGSQGEPTTNGASSSEE